MAYSRRFKKRSKRTTKYRRGARKSSKLSMLASLGKGCGFPRRLYAKLTYTEGPVDWEFSTAGVPQTQTYRINSLFDPNATGVGSQPRWFDSLCGADDSGSPYHTYLVYGARVTVTIVGADSTPTNWCVGFRQDTAAAPSSVQEACELRSYHNLQVGYYQSGKAYVRKTFFMPLHTLFGCSKQAIRDGQGIYDAVYNGNPARVGYVDIIGELGTSAGGNTLFVTTRIDYYCKFSDLQLTPSS